MNDHDAMTQVAEILDRWFRGEITKTAALYAIAHTTGQNAIEHNAAKTVTA